MSDTGAPHYIPLVENGMVTPEVPLRDMAQIINDALISFAGTWSSATQYYKSQFISFDGNMYLANAENKNKTPSSSAEWDLLVAGAIGADGKGYFGQSTSPLLIGLGAKSFTTTSNLAYIPGSRLKAVSDADPANYMIGEVVSYVTTTLAVNVTEIGGSGTFADWSFTLMGEKGKGIPGDPGDPGDPGLAGAPFLISAIDVIANRGTYDGEDPGFTFVASDESKLYLREGATGWSDGVPIGAIADNRIVIAGGFFDVPGDADVVLRFITPIAYELPSGLTGSTYYNKTDPTAGAAFDIKKNTTSIGTMTISTSGVATFTFASGVSFTAGDVLTVIAPATADATLADGAISLLGEIL